MIEAIGFMLLQSIALAFYLFMPLWAHLITLRSLQRKVPEQAESPRYSLADIMILMALISIGTALGSYAKIDQDTENWILIVSLNLLLVLMWYKCNRLMRINAINENKSRILMQVFTYPSSVLALSFLLLSAISALTGAIAGLVPEYNDPVVRELPNNLFCVVVAVGWIDLTRRSFSLILDRNPLRSAA